MLFTPDWIWNLAKYIPSYCKRHFIPPETFNHKVLETIDETYYQADYLRIPSSNVSVSELEVEPVKEWVIQIKDNDDVKRDNSDDDWDTT